MLRSLSTNLIKETSPLRRKAMRYLLFVCTHNAGRSQIAQAFFERHGTDARARAPADLVLARARALGVSPWTNYLAEWPRSARRR